MSDLKTKKEQRAKLVTELQNLGGLVKQEGRAFTAEEKETFSRMKTECSALRDEIETLEELHNLSDITEIAHEVERSAVQSTRRLPSAHDQRLAFRGWLLGQRDAWAADLSEDHKVAAARCGVNLHAESVPTVSRQQTVGTAAEGGYLVPAPELGQIQEILKAYGGMRENVTYLNKPTGRGLAYPVIDDTTNVAGRLSELAAVTNTSLTVSEVEIAVASYRSAVFPVSKELIMDSAYPLEALIAKKLGERLARVINTHATTHASFVGITNGLTADAFEFTLAGLTYTDVVTMKNKLDDAYADNAKWMFNKNMLQEFELMVDGEGRPLWRPDLVNGVPKTVCGIPYIVNRDLDDDTILFGDFAEAYTMVEVGSPEVAVLKERYLVENNAIAVVIFGRFGGKVVVPQACKKFARAAA